MHGFKTNQGDIQDIFKFIATDNMQITENQFEFAQMQNGNIWVLTKRSHLIWKAPLESLSDRRGGARISEVDDDILKRKPIKKMYVDPRGLHCFFLAEHEIYYNNWNSNRVYQITTRVDNAGQPKTFRSIDLQYVTPGDFETFEILLGTEDGQIYHACISFSPTKNTLEYMDNIQSVFETGDYRPILDLKIAKVGGRQVVLAITDTPTTLH